MAAMSSSGATRQMLGIGDTSGRRETLEDGGFYQMGGGREEGERESERGYSPSQPGGQEEGEKEKSAGFPS